MKSITLHQSEHTKEEEEDGIVMGGRNDHLIITLDISTNEDEEEEDELRLDEDVIFINEVR